MKLFCLIGIIAIATFAFQNHKCEHTYVAIVQPDVAIHNQMWYEGDNLLPAWPSGKHEGEEIVCVKCFHIRKQILDYGPDQFRVIEITSGLSTDTTFHPLVADTFKCLYPPSLHFKLDGAKKKTHSKK